MKNTLLRKISLRRGKKNAEYTPVAVVGGGSWATALVKILCENKVRVRWWLRDKQAIKHIKKYRHNPDYLSNVSLHRRKVEVFADLKKAVQEARYVIIAVPAAFVQDALKELSPEDFEGKILVSAVKGIVPEKNLLVTELLEQSFGLSSKHICVIAGPCHAEEVAQEKKSFLTIGSVNLEAARQFAELLNCRYIHTSLSPDPLGIEYAAVLKNIIALACGIARGLNYGDNFQAVLVSNATVEIARFLEAAAPQENRNLNASAYLGDLLVTAYSQFSRNRTFGNMIGRGYTVNSAQVEMNMIAEGYYAVKSIHTINQQYQIPMPISQAVYDILYENVVPASALGQLSEQMA